MTILFLNENPIPKPFTKAAIAGKELRLRAAIEGVDAVHVISRPGRGVVNPHQSNTGAVEKQITVHHTFSCPYYLAAIPLFFYGLFYAIKLKPQVIEAESPISGIAAVLLGKIFNKPTTVEVRSSFISLAQHRFPWLPPKGIAWTVERVIGWVLKNATTIICNSHQYQKQIHKKYQLKSTVINPGLQYAPQKPILKRPTTPIKIGYLGRLVSEKGVKHFLKSVQILKKNPNLPIFLIEIAGTGAQENSLKQYVKHHNLTNYVSFLGFQPNYKILKTWQILVNPITVPTPLEMVNAEAAYMGVPTVCFNHQGLPETVRHQETGLKVTPTTSQALANGLTYLLTQPEKRRQMGHNAHHFAKKHYAVSQQIKSLKTIYRSLNLP